MSQKMQRRRYIIGIDEVGRGSLAGPLTVAAVRMPQNLRFQAANFKSRLRDSKKLTAKQREIWFEYLTNHPKISYALSRVYPRTIEKKNVGQAANLAALRAFLRLSKTYNLKPSARGGSASGGKTYQIYLDGGLYLGNNPDKQKNQRKSAKNQRSSAATLTRGDEKIKAIKIASIIAKVSRDRYMARLARKYPPYKLEVHKGYGTKVHLTALKKYGPSDVHRLTFVRFLQNSKRST